jgi:tetratricopeptide (TPR) repeat protein
MLYTHDRAIILNDLANSYALEMRYSKAIERYKEALSLYILLAKKEPLIYGIHIAHIFSNLSIIYLNLEKNREADAFHQHSLKMHRALVKHNLSKYGVGLASCVIEGVFYLKQHSLTLYEAEGVLHNFRGDGRAERLLQAIGELRKKRGRE